MAKNTRRMDAITTLKKDHEKVKQLLSRLSMTTARGEGTRRKLLDEIERELRVHTAIEQEIIYPRYLDAARKKDERATYFEAMEEHRIVETVISDLRAADPVSEEFAGKAHLLKELVEHHIKEEEREMFPLLKRAIPKEQMEPLLEEMGMRRQQLQQGPLDTHGEVVERARTEGASARRADLRDVDENIDTARESVDFTDENRENRMDERL